MISLQGKGLVSPCLLVVRVSVLLEEGVGVRVVDDEGVAPGDSGRNRDSLQFLHSV